MENVINFRDKVEEIEPLIWKCNCGNCAFLIGIDGSLECSDCGTYQNGCNAHLTAIRKWTRKKDAT